MRLARRGRPDRQARAHHRKRGFRILHEEGALRLLNISSGVSSIGGSMVPSAAYGFNARMLSTGDAYRVKLAETWLAPA